MASQETGDLVRAAREGNPHAAGELFRRFAPAALRVATLLAKDRDTADDLVQDVFIQCLGKLDTLRNPEQFVPWLLRCLRNRAFNQQAQQGSRQRALARLAEEQELGDMRESPADLLLADERRVWLRRAMDELPEGPLKETAERYYLHDAEDVAEVATQLGVPTSTVTTRLDRFRRRLRKRLLAALAAQTATLGTIDPTELCP